MTAAAGSMQTFGFFGLVGAKVVDKEEEDDDEGIAFVTLGNETADAPPEVIGIGEVGIRLAPLPPLLMLLLLLLPLDSMQSLDEPDTSANPLILRFSAVFRSEAN